MTVLSNIKYTVIIPVKEINDYVIQNIKKIKNENRDDVEIIVLPNKINLLLRDAIIFETGKISPGEKRDLGAAHAKGEWLLFLDDDSYPNEGYFLALDRIVATVNLSAYGGPGITPRDNNFWQHVSGSVFLSRWTGGFPERYLSIGEPKIVEDWPSVNLIVNTNAFMSVGGFNTKYWPGEDSILCEKLNKHTFLIQYRPDLVVWHHRRQGLKSHIKQVGNYGLHRGFFFKKKIGASYKLKYICPSLIVIYLLLSMVFMTFLKEWNEFLIGWFLYLIIIIKGVIEIKKIEGFRIAISSIPYVFITHFIYGLMFMVGLCKSKIISELR